MLRSRKEIHLMLTYSLLCQRLRKGPMSLEAPPWDPLCLSHLAEDRNVFVFTLSSRMGVPALALQPRRRSPLGAHLPFLQPRRATGRPGVLRRDQNPDLPNTALHTDCPLRAENVTFHGFPRSPLRMAQLSSPDPGVKALMQTVMILGMGPLVGN